MTVVDDQRLTRLTTSIKRQFGRYLRRSGHTGQTLAMHLPKILNDWVALPTWREQFKIDDLLPHEWVAIREHIVNEYRTRWQEKSAATRAANKKRAKIKMEAKRQASFDF